MTIAVQMSAFGPKRTCLDSVETTGGICGRQSFLQAEFGSTRHVAKVLKFHVVDTSSGLTDSDWAAIDRVNRACELGSVAAFWDELEKLEDVSPQLRVVGAFFPELIREVIEEEMTEHGLTVEHLREMVRRKGEWQM
jgi:hypothetical protein